MAIAAIDAAMTMMTVRAAFGTDVDPPDNAAEGGSVGVWEAVTTAVTRLGPWCSGALSLLSSLLSDGGGLFLLVSVGVGWELEELLEVDDAAEVEEPEALSEAAELDADDCRSTQLT